MTVDDDWLYFPQQFGLGSTHDLSDAPRRPGRLAGLHSVRNQQGGIVRPQEQIQRQPIGFHRPR